MVITRDSKGRFTSNSAMNDQSNGEDANDKQPDPSAETNGEEQKEKSVPVEEEADTNNLIGQMRNLFAQFEVKQSERFNSIYNEFRQLEGVQKTRINLLRNELKDEFNDRFAALESRLAGNTTIVQNDLSDDNSVELSFVGGNNNGNGGKRNVHFNDLPKFGKVLTNPDQSKPQITLQNFAGTSNTTNGNELIGVLHDLVVGMERRTDELIRSSQNQQFAQLSATIKEIGGNEGRSHLSSYFANFEVITEGWSEIKRAQLLVTHLTGQARIVFDGLSCNEQNSYTKIKNAILRSGGGNNLQRLSAQTKLQNGVKPEYRESLRDFGVRVLALVRDSMLPSVPDTAIEDLAKSYFLNGIANIHIRNSLSMIHDSTKYYALIDKAEELRERSAQFLPNFANKNQNQPLVPNKLPSSFLSSNKMTTQTSTQQRVNGPGFKNGTGANSTPLGFSRANLNGKQQKPQFGGGKNVFVVEPNDEEVTNDAEDDQNQPENEDEFIDSECVFLGTNIASINASDENRKRDILVPLKNPQNGIEFALMDSSGSLKTIKIGRPRGPVCSVKLKIGGQNVRALVDSGATINVMSSDTYKKFGLQNSHNPIYAESIIADTQNMVFLAAISLPVEIGEKNIWVEFHICERLPFPVIFGTASLFQLGFELIEPISRKNLLKIEDKPDKNSALVTCIGAQIIKPFSKKVVEVKADVPDGDYIFEATNLEHFLITVTESKAKVVVENNKMLPMNVSSNSLVGKLQPINKNSVICAVGGKENLEANTKVDAEKAKQIMEMIKINGNLDVKQRDELLKLFIEFGGIFAMDESELGQSDSTTHKIELTENKVIKIPRRPVPYAYREKLAEMINDYLERGVIRPSNSPYSAPIVLAKKKNGSLRMCVDYRLLNQITKKDAYPLPNIDSMLLFLGEKRFFSSLDLLSGYWQIKMDPDSVEKTAFSTMDGHYEFIVMPFGLSNAPSTFERCMEGIFVGIIGKFVFIYLDDILIASQTWSEHLEHLRQVFQRIATSGLKINPRKCELVAEEIEFLGHTLTSNGLKMNTKKIEAIKNYPIPRKVKELQCFLGLAGYYRKFIKDFAILARPLYSLLKGNMEYKWDECCQSAFEIIIKKITEDVTLVFPDFKAAVEDEMRAFVIQTDASKSGIGGILGQLDGKGNIRPIYFVSRVCKDAETRYGISELEALALKFSVQKFAPFIVGIKTIVETDHSALVQMFSKPKDCGSPRVNKWALQIMSRFDLVIKYKPGKSNANADALSRATEMKVGVAAIGNNLEVQKEIEWKTAQSVGEFGMIYKYINDRTLPNNAENLSMVLEKMANFIIQNGLLYYIDGSEKPRLVVPREFQEKLFHERHSGTFGIHASAVKMYEMLRKDYFWTNMRADIEKWVRACPVCVCCREPRKNTPPLVPIVPDGPFDLICMDILKLGLTSCGNKYALVCVDHFTKFLFAEPLKTKSAEEAARVFVEQVILKFGPPKKIHSDKGKEFINNIMTHMTKILNIKQTTTSGYNPRSNGLTERANRDIISMLRKSCILPQEWDLKLPFVVFGHNIEVHNSTKESPFYMLFGHDPFIPSNVNPNDLPTNYMVDIAGYKEMLAENLGMVIEKAKNELEKARNTFKKYYDKRNMALSDKYRVGERVMILEPNAKIGGKLNFKFYGPYRIISIHDNKAEVKNIFGAGKNLTIPLDRLSKVPVECHDFDGGKGRRNEIILRSAAQAQTNLIINCSISDLNLIMETKTYENIGTWTSAFKSIKLFKLHDEGIGIYSKCIPGQNKHENCLPLLISSVIPFANISAETKSLPVHSLGGQLTLRALEADEINKIEEIGPIIDQQRDKFLSKPSVKQQLLIECQRKLQHCLVARGILYSQFQSEIPIRCIGKCGVLLNCSHDEKNAKVVHENNKISDLIGPAFESSYLRCANELDKIPIEEAFIGFIPCKFILPDPVDKFIWRQYETLSQIIASLKRTNCTGFNQALVIFLPKAKLGDAELLSELFGILACFPHITSYILPPPPDKFHAYEATIDALLAYKSDHIVTNVQFRGRTVFSIGWTGTGVNKFLAVDGNWTKAGITAVGRFMNDCLGLWWAFQGPARHPMPVTGPPTKNDKPSVTGRAHQKPSGHLTRRSRSRSPHQPTASHRRPSYRPSIVERITIEPSVKKVPNGGRKEVEGHRPQKRKN